jgi:hypothetical protein
MRQAHALSLTFLQGDRQLLSFLLAHSPVPASTERLSVIVLSAVLLSSFPHSQRDISCPSSLPFGKADPVLVALCQSHRPEVLARTDPGQEKHKDLDLALGARVRTVAQDTQMHGLLLKMRLRVRTGVYIVQVGPWSTAQLSLRQLDGESKIEGPPKISLSVPNKGKVSL